ncbi:hypothetical protein LTR16_004619, partial [Cryomyces antarcticus]
KQKLFTNASFEALWRRFDSMARDPSLGTVYCVVDGLDECDEASLEVLLERVRALFSADAVEVSEHRLCFVAVSRECPDFVARESSGFPRIRLDPDADDYVNSDIKKFITDKVVASSTQRHYPPGLRSQVEQIF